MENTKANYKFAYFIIFLILLTSSFDVFLTFKIAGLTVRFSQIISLILMYMYAVRIVKKQKLITPIGYKNLFSWTFLLILFTFNTVLPYLNISYNLWLIFNIIIIFAFTELIDNKDKNYKIIKLYIMSFFIIAIVGIVEFLLSMIGIKVPYITQWWITDILPRINGFSYEPSYYATYLLIGWTLCRVLEQNNITIVKNQKFILITITIAIILSSSRIGIALMIVYEVWIWIKNLIKGKHIIYLFFMTIIGIIILIVGIKMLNSGKYNFLLNGTGVSGTSSHSVSARESSFEGVLKVFFDSPIIGRGLGGIYAEIAVNRGIDVLEIATTKSQITGTAINVFAEVLAGSGIFGFIFFIVYWLTLIIKPLQLAKKCSDKTDKSILIALSISLLIETIILQLNQNILRYYVWLHISVLSATYNNIKNNRN